MGYRSEVAIKCEEKAYELFKQVFMEKELHIKPDTIYKDKDCYILYWDYIKWYSDFDGVKEIENVMLDLDDHGNEDGGYGYMFIRLGEDLDDTEMSTNDWNIDLWVIRKIDIPDGIEEVDI